MRIKIKTLFWIFERNIFSIEHWIITVLLLLFVSGCATTPRYETLWEKTDEPGANYYEDRAQCAESDFVKEYQMAFERAKTTGIADRFLVLDTGPRNRPEDAKLSMTWVIDECMKHTGWKKIEVPKD